MLLHTPLCDLPGIDVPIFAAPMGFITGPELAAAVSNAGGLGIMSFSANPPPVLREQIRRLRSLTNRPFGVNVLLNGPHLPFPIDTVVDVCLKEHVPVLSTFWVDPTPYVARAHAAGVKVIDQVGSVADAQRAAQVGVDAIVSQGVEAGRHIAGEVTTMALMPCVVDAVAPLPVVAAGGIADARGLVAALALGAQAVMTGVPSHAQGRGPVPMGSCAFVDAIGAAWQSTVARRAHRDPVRPPARRLPARHAGARGRDRTPRRVSPEPRRLGPASAPRPSRPCPGRVLSRSGPDMLGPQACCGGLRPPLRSRPTCETPGHSSCRRCHHASPPLPWRMCPGGSKPHKPGPAGSG
jgi:nitronate monooxygenase